MYFRLYHFNSRWVNVRKAIKLLTKYDKCSYMGVNFDCDNKFFTVCVCFLGGVDV